MYWVEGVGCNCEVDRLAWLRTVSSTRVTTTSAFELRMTSPPGMDFVA